MFVDGRSLSGGRVELAAAPPDVDDDGVPLFARVIDVLPPVDAVFEFGSPAVGAWLDAHGWDRRWGYNVNFQGRPLVEQYEAVERAEHPLYREGAYASLGGWHVPWPDEALADALTEQLLVRTYKDAEPWVEVRRAPTGELRVVQQIT